MKAYQADIAKFTDTDTKVFGLSVDSVPALKYWAEHELAPETKGLSFPILSDFVTRKTVKDYGVFNEATGFGMATTLIKKREVKTKKKEEGNTAVNPTQAIEACSILKKKVAQ